MATATAPRNEIYLSVLAGRAVTALADLAGDASAWSQRIEEGLQDGVEYCRAVRNRVAGYSDTNTSLGWVALKRSVEDAPEGGAVSADLQTEAEEVEHFFSQLLSRERTPEVPELVAAIQFLRKTATDY